MAEVKSELKLGLVEQVQTESKRLKSMEQLLGYGLHQPFNNTNSSPRKLMQGVQLQHALGILYPEPPILSTGYENRFGEKSSTFLQAQSDYEVIGRINKFSFTPDEHYYVIIRDINTNKYDVIERIAYDYVTEDYGIILNNTYLDNLKPGDKINKGTTIKKSLAFDEYDNRQDGRNIMTTYMSLEHNKEDAIIISDVAAQELAAPLIKKITITVNDNDTLLNLYGNESLYKVIPNIGEEVQHGILCALRRRKKEESLFSESYYRLSQLMMSDEKIIVKKGKVIDVDVYCNNPEAFENYTNSQLKNYNDELLRFNREVVEALDYIIKNNQTSYSLQKLYYRSKKLLDGGQYIKEKPFSNIVIDIVVLEERAVANGDKLANRYGGKGCVSQILPEHLMPRLDNGKHVGLIFNSSGVNNRKNNGQQDEMSLNFIGQRIIDYSKILPMEDIMNGYLTFLEETCPNQYYELKEYIDKLSKDELKMFMDSVLSDKGIRLCMKPITESITIDDLSRIYDRMAEVGLPIKQYEIEVPQADSNGNYRYVKSRRRMVCAYQYIYRLKQYSEEKFSATSLSSTNIKNENSKSSSKKYYRAAYSQTPIRFGEMETGDFAHVGFENTILNLMICSVSPQGRRLLEGLLVGDPFNINVKLDDVSRNRGVEILNTYLLTMGLKLNFIKKPKNIRPLIKRDLITYYRGGTEKLKPLLSYVNKNEVFDKEKYLEYIEKCASKKLKPLLSRDLLTYELNGDEMQNERLPILKQCPKLP